MNVLYFAKIEPLGSLTLIFGHQTATCFDLRRGGGLEYMSADKKVIGLDVTQVLLILSKKSWDEKGGEQNTHY